VSFLLDTNVISELRRKTCDARVAAWFGATESADLYISVLVVGELRQGIDRIRRRGDKKQAGALDRWLDELKSEYADRFVEITTAVAERWGAMNAVRPLPEIDGLQAATAIERDFTFVTREHGALESTGVALLDPWRAT
jgi:predicted nucleic acid-binding protein